MAGEWIKFDSSLPEKPETLAITAAMGWTDPDLTVGKLMRLFRWFDQQTVDGNAARVTPALLDHVLGVTGLTLAVASVGWITVTDAGLSLSKFDRHNGESAKQRAQTAKRVAKHKGNAKGNGEGNAAGVSSALPREEKRREEISPTNVGEGAKRPAKRCPADFVVTDEMRGWAAAEFPAVDLGSAVAKFRDHTFTKAITDWPATLRNWIRKESEFAAVKKPAAVMASFAQQEEAARRKRWEEMTGRKWPTDGDVIDITPDQQRISA